MKVLKKIISGLLVMNMVLLTGCWNYREIDTLAIVAGFAIDKGSSGKGYHLTFDTVDVTGGSKEGTAKSEFIETDGDTLFEAVRSAIKKSDKKLYFGDCKAVLISKTIAEDGILPVLDWLNRDSEPRLTLNLLVSRTDSAKELLLQKSDSQIVSYIIDKSVKNDAAFLSRDPYVQLYQANNLLADNGICLVLPFIKLSDDQEKSVELSGMGIFKNDRLVGDLSCNEAMSFMFIRNLVKGGLFLVKVKSSNPDVTLEISKSHTKVIPVFTNHQVKLNIHVKCEVFLGENESKENFDTDEKIKQLQKTASQQLNQKLTDLIHQIQAAYSSDIFGFGHSIYEANPQYWNEIKPDWDTGFKTVSFSVSSEFKILNTADIKSKIQAGESG